MKKTKRKSRKIWIALLIFLFVALAIFSIVATSVLSYAKLDETRKADVAIVLGAQIYDDEPSPVFEERIKHGIELYHNGTVKCIIFTGGKTTKSDWSEAAVAKKYAMEHGVPEEDIYIEEISKITEENMTNAKALMEEMGMKDALIVSDPLHMKRAMLMAADCEIVAYSSPTPTSRYVSFFSKTKFLARETILLIGYWLIGLFR